MSRTLRRDRKNNDKKVSDGKQPYKCKCSWCLSEDKKKSTIKFYLDEIKKYSRK